jgi:endonuclease YncB( thermonuclease family)
MAGVAAIGCALFAIVALKDGSFDWHRYTSIVGFIVLACAASWGLSALTAIAFQTSRRWTRGRAAPKMSGPWGGHGTVVPLTSRARRGGERWGLPGVSVLAAAFVIGFGGFFLFYMLTAGDGDGTRVNIFRGSAEIVQFGRISDSDPTEKPAIKDGAGGGYSLCQSVAQQSCVVDGDTIRHGGSKIRIADIDTPEISEPKCASEAALGHRAKERLLELLNQGPFDVVHPGGRDEDVYGRKLRTLMRGGRSLGMILVDEGLARRWTGARRSWCV